MPTAVNILLATSAVSFVSLIGVVFLSVREALLNRLAVLLVAFASGGLLGGVFFHLVPEALQLAGELFFYLGHLCVGNVNVHPEGTFGTGCPCATPVSATTVGTVCVRI